MNDDLIPFGMYKGKRWEDAPSRWLYWLANSVGNSPGRTRARKELDARRRKMGLKAAEWKP